MKTTTLCLGLGALVALTSACSDDNDATASTGSGASGPSSSASTGGSTSSAGGSGGGGDLDITVCDPAEGPFSLTIDNPYLPYAVGTVFELQGMEGATVIDLRITVLDETEDVAGVTTRVVEEYEEEDGELIEISRNFFVQAPDGTVCYYGEDVDIYEGGNVVSHEGEWRAGEGESKPGIAMPANPAVGMTYQQEVAPGIAMDRAEIVSIGGPFTVPAGTYRDTLSTEESSPLDAGAVSEKTYARDVGLIYDDGAELLTITNM